MAQGNCQKIKLLKLYELLQQETDEEHPMKCYNKVVTGVANKI